MTQILGCLTNEVVVMAADRRLTKVQRDGTVEVVDDEAAKVVLPGTQVAVGYSGLANVRPPPRGQTDWWLLDTLSPPGPVLADTFERLRVNANETFRTMSHVGPRAKRHAFVAVGWAPVAGHGHRPFYVSISNALTRYGRWQQTSRREFTTRVERLREKVPFRLDETGQPLPSAVKQRLRAALLDSDNRVPNRLASLLAEAVRETAAANQTVGKGLLVTVLPREGANRTGGLSVSNAERFHDSSERIAFPKIEGPCSFYVPAETGTGITYAPRYADDGLQVAEAFMLDRGFDTDEEVERYFAPLIERFKKGIQ